MWHALSTKRSAVKLRSLQDISFVGCTNWTIITLTAQLAHGRYVHYTSSKYSSCVPRERLQAWQWVWVADNGKWTAHKCSQLLMAPLSSWTLQILIDFRLSVWGALRKHEVTSADTISCQEIRAIRWVTNASLDKVFLDQLIPVSLLNKESYTHKGTIFFLLSPTLSYYTKVFTLRATSCFRAAPRILLLSLLPWRIMGNGISFWE